MSADDRHDDDSSFHFEHGIPILDTRLDDIECEQAEARKRDKEYRDEQLRLNRRMVWFTLALVVCTAIVGGINGWQARSANRSAKAAEDTVPDIKKSADAAKRAAETATDTLANQKITFQIEERPYVVLSGRPQITSPLDGTSPILANVTLKNIGKTPSLKIIWHVALLKFIPGKDEKARQRFIKWLTHNFDILRSKNETVKKEIANMNPALSNEQDLAPEDTLFTTNDPVTLSIEESATLKKRDADLVLFYIGSVNYTDHFGGTYQTEFCNIFWGPDPNVWHICDAHNTIK